MFLTFLRHASLYVFVTLGAYRVPASSADHRWGSAAMSSFPALERVGEPLHGLVEALALRRARLEDLEGPVLERLQPQGLVNLKDNV